jgi:hypothetical protein
MKRGLRLVLLLPAVALIGCALPSNSTSGAALYGTWTNWQIQQGSAITSPPNTYPSFTGALLVQGTTASGTFTILDSATTTTPGVAFSGPVNSSGVYISLSNAVGGYQLPFSMPLTPSVTVPVDVMDWCGLCNTGRSLPSVEVEIPPLTGTYVGTLNDGTPSMSGTATLVLTQSTTPNSSGQFPLSGTITFPSGSGFGTAPLAGSVAGEGIALSDPSAAPNSPSIDFTASANPTATQIAVTSLTYSGSGASATFTGTLTRQ